MINDRRTMWQMLFLAIEAGCIEREELRFEDETLSRGERWYAVPKGDLRFEETSDYQASDGRLSDRSVANTFPDNGGRLRSAGGFLDSVETLHRVPKSAEVGPRRTMVRFISLLTIVHPLPLRGVPLKGKREI